MNYSYEDWKKIEEKQRKINEAGHRLGRTPEKHLQWLLKIGQEPSPSRSTFRWEFNCFLGLDGDSCLPGEMVDPWLTKIRK